MYKRLLKREKEKSEGHLCNSRDRIPTKGVFRFSRDRERTFYFYSALVVFIIYILTRL